MSIVHDGTRFYNTTNEPYLVCVITALGRKNIVKIEANSNLDSPNVTQFWFAPARIPNATRLLESISLMAPEKIIAVKFLEDNTYNAIVMMTLFSSTHYMVFTCNKSVSLVYKPTNTKYISVSPFKMKYRSVKHKTSTAKMDNWDIYDPEKFIKAANYHCKYSLDFFDMGYLPFKERDDPEPIEEPFNDKVYLKKMVPPQKIKSYCFKRFFKNGIELSDKYGSTKWYDRWDGVDIVKNMVKGNITFISKYTITRNNDYFYVSYEQVSDNVCNRYEVCSDSEDDD